MSLSIDLYKKYTYADYISWIDDVRRELINGFIKLMSPAPARKHQCVVLNLGRTIGNFLDKKSCKVYIAPFDVRLPNNENSNELINTVVQPDVSVICDNSKLDDKGCIGAPDLIIEIVSPTSLHHDTVVKHKVYEQAGVLEYWIVFPGELAVEVFQLINNKFILRNVYTGNDNVPVGIFNDQLFINVADIFSE